MKTQMQVWLEIHLKQVLKTVLLGWQGNNRHSCKGASPSLSFPYTWTSEHYRVKHKYLQWLLWERDLALSTTNKIMPQRSRQICVADTLTTQQHKETSCAFWTLYSLFLFFNCTLHIVKWNSKMQSYPKETFCPTWTFINMSLTSK